MHTSSFALMFNIINCCVWIAPQNHFMINEYIANVFPNKLIMMLSDEIMSLNFPHYIISNFDFKLIIILISSNIQSIIFETTEVKP